MYVCIYICIYMYTYIIIYPNVDWGYLKFVGVSHMSHFLGSFTKPQTLAAG